MQPARADGGAAWLQQAAHVFRPDAQDAELPFELIPEALAQDGQGFLWLGGEAGLVRWDGYGLLPYVPARGQAHSMPNQSIQCMHLDAQGTLWVGTVTGGLARYDPDHDTFRTVLDDILTGDARHVWSLDDDGAGGLFLATGAGLFRMNAEGTAITRVDLGISAASRGADDPVLSVLRDRRGVLWAGTQHGLARRVAPNAPFEPVSLPSEDGATVLVSRLMQDSEGRIWAGTRQHGAYVIDEAGRAARSVAATAALGRSSVATEITAMLEVAPNRVWLGTYGNGIFEVAGGDAEHAGWIRHQAGVPFSLPGDSVQSLYRDRSGLVWVGTSEGLSQTSPGQSAIQTIFGDPDRKDGLTAENVMSVLAQPDGSLWAGSQGKGYDVLTKTGALTGVLPGRRVFGLVAAPAGGVLVGTDGGLYWADPQGKPKARLVLPKYSGVVDVRALCVLNGTIWVGSRDNGIWHLAMAQDGSLSLLGHWDGGQIGGSRVLAIGQSQDGRVAVGVEDGFSLIDPATGVVERVHTDPADPATLGQGSVVSFLTDRSGRLWVGTSDTGINVMEGRNAAGRLVFRHIGLAEGLPNNDINKMLLDSAGLVWASTDNGIAVVNPGDLNVRALRRADGVAIKGYWVGAGDRMADGALIFGGGGGITVVHPDKIKTWHYLPPVVVTGVRLGGKSVPFRTEEGGSRDAGEPGLVVPPGTANLAVEFVALDFSAPERNRYRYRLDGFDQGWIEADATHRVATYTNLPPGDFTLRIEGSNRDGIWAGQEAVLHVRVLPAWYQALWFKLLAGGSAVLALGGAFYAWSFVARQRQHELQRQVAERTAELSASQKQLQQYAYFDTLTGLQNRRAFNEKFHAMLEEAQEATGRFALLLIDLDDFKQVNDVFGHDAGDALLVQTSRRLGEAVREHDFLARLGGDEFAVLLPNIRDLDIVEKICSRVVEAVGAPMMINGTSMKAGASVGAGVFPEHGASQEDLYRHVDQALYEAKRAGRGAWQWYRDSGLRIVQ
jgi:diguanylate cyclase (GGDEF)-like protein